MPFSYLFSESAGFVGHKKGVISRVYETFTVFSLLAVVVLGITFVISALIDRERSGLQTLLCKLFFFFAIIKQMNRIEKIKIYFVVHRFRQQSFAVSIFMRIMSGSVTAFR